MAQAQAQKGLEFDPGFAPYIFAFQGTIKYLYTDINKFKNFSQKKLKFRQYHKKMLELFYNNLGFYIGCLMWAAYLKAQPEQEILNNPCFGVELSEEENIYETVFMIKFLELYPKDMKYFLGENYKTDSDDLKILEMYKEFLILNKGFAETKNNTDILLPQNIKYENVEELKNIIEDAIKNEDLSKLVEHKGLIL